MKLNARIERKISRFDLDPCVVKAVVELPQKDFSAFSQDMLSDHDFIRDAGPMGVEDGVSECLLVLGKGSEDGYLVCNSGYAYARYIAHLPGARAVLRQEMQMLAQQILQENEPHPGFQRMIAQQESIDKMAGFPVPVRSIQHEMLTQSLVSQQGVSSVLLHSDHIEVICTPAFYERMQSLKSSAQKKVFEELCAYTGSESPQLKHLMAQGFPDGAYGRRKYGFCHHKNHPAGPLHP